MAIHNPPCRSGTDHMDLEIDAGDSDNESLMAFTTRFIADREAEMAALVRDEIRERVGGEELETRFLYGDK